MFSLEYIDFIGRSEVIVLNYLLNWKISVMWCIAKMVIWTFSSDGTRGLASLCLKDLFFANQTVCKLLVVLLWNYLQINDKSSFVLKFSFSQNPNLTGIGKKASFSHLVIFWKWSSQNSSFETCFAWIPSTIVDNNEIINFVTNYLNYYKKKCPCHLCTRLLWIGEEHKLFFRKHASSLFQRIVENIQKHHLYVHVIIHLTVIEKV